MIAGDCLTLIYMKTVRQLTFTVITALFVVAAALLWASASPKVTGQTSPTRELSLEKRISYQQRVENVYKKFTSGKRSTSNIQRRMVHGRGQRSRPQPFVLRRNSYKVTVRW